MKKNQFANQVYSSVLLMLVTVNTAFTDDSHHVNNTNITLISNSKPVTVVVVGQNAEPFERLAASELSKYIEILTGVRPETVDDNVPVRYKTAILVGRPENNRYLNQLRKEIPGEYPQLPSGNEGYSIASLQSQGNAFLVITGNKPAGVLYGTYRFVEEIIRIYSGLAYADIDFRLDGKLKNLQFSNVCISDEPYCSFRGMELSCFGLQNKVLLDAQNRKKVFQQWVNYVDFCRRHRLNFITNWPYYDENSNMNNFPDMVVLPGYKKISYYSAEEIKTCMAFRREILSYAKLNGVDPYLTIYVPGWVNEATARSYPEFLGKAPQEGWLKDKKIFCWANPQVQQFMADLATAVAQSYPEIRGLHLRVWGGESAPCACHADRHAELIRAIMKKMVEAAVKVRPDIRIIISGYSCFEDDTFEYGRSLPGDIVFQRKWSQDWEPVDDPKIPASWLNKPDLNLMISQSVPVEEITPFWFPCAQLYQAGVQKYIKHEKSILDGFPIVSRDWDVGLCDNDLNFVALAKLSWDPFSFDYRTFYRDTYANMFGKDAAEFICQATDLNCTAMENFLVDYGGLVEGMGPGNYYNLLSHILGQQHENGNKRFNELTARVNNPEKMLAFYKKIKPPAQKQFEAVQLLEKAQPQVKKNQEYFSNMLNVNRALYCIMKIREYYAHAILLEMAGSAGFDDYADKAIALESELEKSVNCLSNFTNQVDDIHEHTRHEILTAIQQERGIMRSLERSTIKKTDKDISLAILKTINGQQ